MSPLELIGGVIALGLMGAGLKLHQMNRKRSVKVEQPPSPRIIDETPTSANGGIKENDT